MSLRDKILRKGPPGIRGIKPVHGKAPVCTKTLTKDGLRVRYICPPSGGKQAVSSLGNLPFKPEDVDDKIQEVKVFSPEQQYTPKQQSQEPEKVKEAILKRPRIIHREVSTADRPDNLHFKEPKEAGPDTVQDNLHFKEPKEAGPDTVQDNLHFKEPKEAGPRKLEPKKKSSKKKSSKKKSGEEEAGMDKSLFLDMDIYKAASDGSKYLIIDMETPIDKISDLSQIVPVAKRSSKRLVSAEQVKQMASSGKIKGHFAILPESKARSLGLLKSFGSFLNKGFPALALAPAVGAGIAEGLAFAGAMVGSAILVGAGASELMKKKKSTAVRRATAATATAATATAATAAAVPTTAPQNRPGSEKPSSKKSKKSTRRSSGPNRILSYLAADSLLSGDSRPDKPKPTEKNTFSPAARSSSSSSSPGKKFDTRPGSKESGAAVDSAVSEADAASKKHRFKRGAYSDIAGKKRKMKFYQRKQDMNKSASFVAPFARQVLNKKMSLMAALNKVPWHMQDDLLRYLRNKKR